MYSLTSDKGPPGKSKRALFAAACVLIGFLAGLVISAAFLNGRHEEPESRHEPSSHRHSEDEKTDLWTCSMHPQILLPGPGKCPICFMDLIPVKKDSGEDGKLGLREIRLSETSRKLAKVRTSAVRKADAVMEGSLIGKVSFDETRLGTITAWTGGRIDRLYVSYTGAFVKKGQEMADIYSPELFSAQSELIEAAKAASMAASAGHGELIKGSAARTASASREKLRLLGLTQEQIDAVVKRGTPSDRVTIHAPLTGFVIRREVTEGVYVKTGTPLYTIADLSRVWIVLEAYESDLPWIKVGDSAEFSLEAVPGKSFSGRITFIEPFLNEKTRTAAVRLEAENPSHLLKPGMYVRAVYRFNPSRNGREDKQALLIPVQAPLITGKRAVVYVEVKGKEGVYEGREIILGPRAGAYYVVEKGLEEGEMVVTQGAFRLDSSIQIQAGPSMMSEGGPPSSSGHSHAAKTSSAPSETASSSKEGATASKGSSAFKKQFGSVVNGYLALAEALAKDDKDSAAKASAGLSKALSAVDVKTLEKDLQQAWQEISGKAGRAALNITTQKDISGMRRAFDDISSSIIGAIKTLGVHSEKPLYEAFCPMAFDGRGAFWVQNDQEIRNPYFGAEMPGCGEIRARLSEGVK